MNYTVSQDDFYQYKKKVHARRELNKAVRAGALIRPSNCQNCFASGRIEGHHTDYGQPLEVVWLCKACHSETSKCQHPLHHAKFKQTAMLDTSLSEKVPITLTISMDAFAQIKRVSEDKGVTMSKLVESLIESRYPFSHQMHFNFEEHAKTFIDTDKAVQDMDMDEDCLLQQKQPKLQELRRERYKDESFMDSQLSFVC